MNKRFKLFMAVFSALLVSVLCVTPAFARTEYKAVADYKLAGPRNDGNDPNPALGGFAGTAFKVGDKDIVVTSVGRMFFKASYDAGIKSHAILIVDASDNSLVLSGVGVPAYEDSVDKTFEYTRLEESEYVTLLANHTYYVTSDFYGASDFFYDSTTVTPSPGISFIGFVTLDIPTGGWNFFEAENINYFPLDFTYYIVGEEEPATSSKSSSEKGKSSATSSKLSSENDSSELSSESNPEEESALPSESGSDNSGTTSTEKPGDDKPNLVYIILIIAVVVICAGVAAVLIYRKKKSS